MQTIKPNGSIDSESDGNIFGSNNNTTKNAQRKPYGSKLTGETPEQKMKNRMKGMGATKNYGKGKNKKLMGFKQMSELKRMKTLVQSSQNSTLGTSGVLGESFAEDNKLAKGNELGFTEVDYHKGAPQQNFRAKFMENYGVEIEFPTYYSADGVIVPHLPDFVVALGFHSIPRTNDQEVQITKQGQGGDQFELATCTFQDLYPMTGNSVILRLNEADPKIGFKTHREVQLNGTKKCHIAFSKNGKFFALFMQARKILTVYDASDIFKMFDDIENEEPYFSVDISENKIERFGTVNRIEFGKAEKYVCIASDRNYAVYSLQGHNLGQCNAGNINPDLYFRILDMQMTSEGCAEGDFKLFVACDVFDVNRIDIFDVMHEGGDMMQITHSKPAEGDQLKVFIAEDCKSSVLSNGSHEHYIHNGVNQQSISVISDKYLRCACSAQDGSFYFALTKDYDRDIDLVNSQNDDWNCSLEKCLEPGLFTMYDMCVTTDPKTGIKLLKTLCRIGDYLTYDVVDIAKVDTLQSHDRKTNSVAHLASYEDRHYGAYGFNWPYFCYATKYKRVFILNAFNPNFIQCYDLPDHVTFISQTFLSDTHDLYAICQTSDQYYEMFQINLDSSDPYVRSEFRYSMNSVEHQKVRGFHVRGSSHKEKINISDMLVAYIMHGDTLWCYVQNNKKLVQVDTNAYNLYYLSDNTVFYTKTEFGKKVGDQSVDHSHIMMVETLPGSFKLTEVFTDLDFRAEILNFGVDNTRNRLLVLTGIRNHRGRRDKFVTIVDVEKQQQLYRLRVQSREIIGRLKTNLYNFVEGHIYYGNKVIKIRYDLIDEYLKSGKPIGEDQFFDFYSDVLCFEENWQVQSGTPMQTCLYNRLAYVVRNQRELKARKLVIMPYLHERRIYLNRRHTDNQFYTLLRFQEETYVMCISWDLSKIHVYTETGKLCDRIIYAEQAQTWGRPLTMSENSHFTLFRPSDYRAELHLVHLEISGFIHQRKLMINEILGDFIASGGINHLEQSERESFNFFWKNFLQKMDRMEDVVMSPQINDTGDLLVRIKPQKNVIERIKKQAQNVAMFQLDDKQLELFESDEGKNASIFFFIPGLANKTCKPFIYYDSPTDEIDKLRGISMNEKYVFLWNDGNVWKINLETQQKTMMQISISLQETATFVKRVRTGSDSNLICIRVTQTPLKDFIIMWDLVRDLEIESFDVDSDAIFFQDLDGNPFIAERDYVYMCRLGCKIKSYRMQVSDFSKPRFDFSSGQRMDPVTHNWLIFRNYINLSFSYMTFVVKDLFDEGYLRPDFLFDLEGYDFIYNRETIFTSDTDLMSQNYDKLLYILSNYEKTDPELLEVLHYSDDEGIPLLKAVANKNHRIVNLLLNKMADINYAAIRQIKTGMTDLLEYQAFLNYLEETPFHTHMMLNKQTLKIPEAEDDEFVCTQGHSTSYVDGDYFRDVVGEDTKDPDFLTFPVRVQACRADWILDDESTEGLEFLRALQKITNIHIFDTSYIRIIIQFLYSRYQTAVLQIYMPLYLFHFLSVFLMIIFNNMDRENAYLLRRNPQSKIDSNAGKIATIFQICALVATIFNIAWFIKQALFLRISLFSRAWTYLDLISLSMNLYLSTNIFIEQNTVTLRCIEALLVIIMCFKSLYFLRLIKDVAPLIDALSNIVTDIKWFAFVFLAFMICHGFALWSIALNQRDLSKDGAVHAEFIGASNIVWNVYNAHLDGFNTDNFRVDSMEPWLVGIYIYVMLFVKFVLLNMLIGLMGESISRSKENSEAKKRLQMTGFVTDNWFLDPIQDKERFVYIISCRQITSEEKVNHEFLSLKSDIANVDLKQTNMLAEVHSLEQYIHDIRRQISK